LESQERILFAAFRGFLSDPSVEWLQEDDNKSKTGSGESMMKEMSCSVGINSTSTGIGFGMRLGQENMKMICVGKRVGNTNKDHITSLVTSYTDWKIELSGVKREMVNDDTLKSTEEIWCKRGFLLCGLQRQYSTRKTIRFEAPFKVRIRIFREFR